MTTDYYIMTFDTTAAVMQAETLIKQHFQTAIMPIPREISSGCGLAVRFLNSSETDICTWLHTFTIPGTLYRMKTTKENGQHPIEKIMTVPLNTI